MAGAPPGAPPAANLTPGGALGRYADADFFRAQREGKQPDGSMIDPFMPYQETKYMTDEEITAMLRYLRTAPAKPFGNH